MPSLTIEQLEKVDVPNVPNRPEFDDLWVVLDVAPMSANDTEEVDQGVTVGSYNIRMIANRIHEWNILDANGQMVPITPENVAKMHIDQFGFLSNKIKKIAVELPVAEKKDLSSISATTIEVKNLE